MQNHSTVSSSTRRANDGPAEAQAMPSQGGSQQFPHEDSAIANVRNVLAMIELELASAKKAKALPILHGQEIRDIQAHLVAAVTELEIADSAVLEHPRRAARETIRAIGTAAAKEFVAALQLQLQEMDQTNRELRDLRLAHDAPAELHDVDRRDDSTGRA